MQALIRRDRILPVCRQNRVSQGKRPIAPTALGLFQARAVKIVAAILMLVWALGWGLAPKHRFDVEVNSMYWYFVIGSWVVLYVVIYLSPDLMKY